MAALSLVFTLLGRDQGASKAFSQVGDAAERAGKQGSAFGSAIKSGIGMAVGAVATAGLGSMFAGFISEAAESQKVGRLTEQVIRTTGGAANITAVQVSKLAGAISNKTAVDDEAIQSASNLLLTFCLEESAQALCRRRGWVSHSELRAGDEILAYDPETGEALWEPVDSVHRFAVDSEEMVRWSSKQIDVLSTPTHRWWTVGGSGYDQRQRFLTTEQISGHRVKVKIGGGTPAGFAEEPTLSDEMVELLPGQKLTPALFQLLTAKQADLLLETLLLGDGHTDRDGHRSYIQKDPEQLAAVAMLCAMLGIRTTVGKRPDQILLNVTDHAYGHRLNARREHYEGVVWCPHLRTGIWMARVRGRTFWTGNTKVRNEAGAGNDVFNQATQAAVDMSVALGVDANAAALQLGKALNDPLKGITALSRAGVSFTEQQKDQIRTLVESGDVLGAQKIILGELQVQFGGAAEAAASPLDRLRVVAANLGEQLGGYLLPVAERFATFLSERAAPAVQGLFELFVNGDFTAEMGRAFGVAEDSGFVDFLFRVRETAISVFDEVTGAVRAFAAGFRSGTGEITASGLPGFFEALGQLARTAFDVFRDVAVPALGTLTSLIVTGVVPAIAEFGSWLVRNREWVVPLVAAIVTFNTVLKVTMAVKTAYIAVMQAYAFWTYSNAAATGVFTTALNVLKVAFLTNPIGIVIAALVALGAAFVVAWNTSETFRSVVTGVWQSVQDGARWMWENVLRPVFTFIVEYWKVIVTGIVWYWSNVLKPAWDAVAAAAVWLWGSVLQPAFAGIKAAWDVLVTGIRWAWENVLRPTWDFIRAAAQFLLTFLAVVIFGPVLVAWTVLVTSIRWAWENVLRPAWDAVAAGAGWLWNNVLRPTWAAMQAGWDALLTAFRWAWENVLRPTWEAVRAGAEWLWNTILRPVFSAIDAAWDAMGRAMDAVYRNVVRPMFDAISSAVGAVRGAFDSAINGIQAAWDRIKGIVAAPVNFVVRTVLRDGLFSAWNWVLEKLGISSWRIDLGSSWLQGVTGYAAGGMIRGPWRGPEADNVLAWVPGSGPIRVNPREYIQPVSAVDRYGIDFMEAVRSGAFPEEVARYYVAGGQIPGFATGGELWNAIRGAFPRAKLNSAYRPGDPGYHGRNMAVDVGELGFAGGAGRRYIADMKRWVADRYGRSNEIIYSGLFSDRPNVKNGAAFNYGPAVDAAHTNHLHWAVAGALLSALGRLGGGPVASGTVAVETPWYMDLWDSLTGAKDWLLGKIGDVGQLTSKFGDSPLVGWLWETVKKLPGAMWDKITDTVTGLFSGAAYDAANPPGAAPAGAVQNIAQSVAARLFGWGSGAEWAAWSRLIQKESSWNPRAQNPTSTAYGLGQFLNSTWATVGGRKTSDPALQMEYMGRYIKQRYGTPSRALAFHLANNWYSSGGQVLPPIAMAGGGIIGEPISGIGALSGRAYTFGERGPETVTPGVERDGAARTVIHVHPAPGQDEYETARLVAREWDWGMR